MKSKSGVDLDKVARGLRASRRGRVASGSGAFGAAQLVAEVRERFQVPKGGGRATDPTWKERRLVPLAPRTLQRLEGLAAGLKKHYGVRIETMQLAALLLEKSADRLTEEEARRLLDD